LVADFSAIAKFLGVSLAAEGQDAVVTGDMIHRAIQACEADICRTFCFDEEQARTTRRYFLKRCSDTGVLVLGTHFCDPTGIHIRPDGDGWRFETAETDTG
jgi:hypothetical protein